MIPLIDITEVRPQRDYRLFLRFSDGSAGIHDFSPLLDHPGPMTTPLKDPSLFAQAFIELGALVWPNGLDLDPIQLHQEMTDAGELSRPAAE